MKVLIVDDNELYRMSLAVLLEDDGFAVAEADSIARGRAALAEEEFDLVVLDMHLPDGTGAALVPEIRSSTPATKTALVTGDLSAVNETAADAVIDKGTAPEDLVATLRALHEHP